jgi:hypothetical protein
MKLKANNSTFEPCPEFTGKAVCVDVTPLRKQQSQFGERDVFKVVFEVDRAKDDGGHYCVWSRNFTPSLNEKANFRRFLRGWFGRDLTASELAGFDTESLIGKPAHVVVVHEHREGQVYANIAACTPDKSGAPLKPVGKYVRVKDRENAQGTDPADGTNGSNGTYRRAQGAEAAGDDHSAVKIHVGRCKGLELRELAPEQIQALVENWLPAATSNPKPTADDKRLIAALQWWKANQQPQAEEDDIPY